MDKTNYTIQELSDILGVSVAAIRKKITTDDNNPNEKRYKKRYPIVFETVDNRQVMQICLTNIELEEEKRLAAKNKIKHSTETTLQDTYTESEENADNVIDIEPLSHNRINPPANISDVVINLTERYNNDLKTYIDRLAEAEGKQLLLEDKANREGLYLQEIKDAKQETKNVIKYFTITLSILFILFMLAIGALLYKFANPTVIEKQVVVEKPVIQQIPAPTPVKKTGRR